MEKVSVIILNYNGKEFLADCLNSVLAQSYSEIEIILVDNGSKDGSVEFVQENYPNIVLIQSKTNLGFAAGNNFAISFATGDYIVLLNNDTVVDKNWLIKLVEKIKSDNCGIVSSLIITDGIPEIFYEKNGTINFLGYNIMREFSDLSQLFYAGGGSLIFSKKLTTRPFLDEYFLYNEDTYFSWKLRLDGFNPLMTHESVVHHLGSATVKKQISSFITFYQERNRLLNCLLFYEAATLLKLTPYFIVDAFSKFILSLFLRRKSFTGILRGYYWIAANSRWILKHRNIIQSGRKIEDKTIMELMSHKLIDSDSTLAKMVNSISKFYASIVRLQYHH